MACRFCFCSAGWRSAGGGARWSGSQAWWPGLAIASLGSRLHIAGRLTTVRLPWRAIQAIPVIDNVLPNRLMLYVFLLAGLLVAVFADAVLTHRKPWSVALRVVALALALLPLLPRSPAPSTRLALPPVLRLTGG